QVRRREAPAIERHQGPKLRRNDRDDFEDHPVGLVAGFEKRLDDLEALDDLLALLDGRLPEHLRAQISREGVAVHVTQELADRLRAHPDFERLRTVLLVELPGLVYAHQVLLLDAVDLRLEDDVLLEVE